MARKTSDIALLLGSRGRSRSRKGGLVPKLVSFVEGLFGGASKKRSLREVRTQKVSVWAFVAGLLLAFVGGFLIGGGVNASTQGEDPLNANGGRKPGFVGEVSTTPLSSQAYVVATYPGVDATVGRQRAVQLSRELAAAGLESARPYEFIQESGVGVWVVAVYYDGEDDAKAVSARLQAVAPDVQEARFVDNRNLLRNSWPQACRIR